MITCHSFPIRSIYHAHKQSGDQQPPQIHIPEGGSMPLCLTSSSRPTIPTWTIPKPTGNASASQTPEEVKKHKKEVAQQIQVLEAKLLALEPGSTEAWQYFKDLPEYLRRTFLIGKDRRQAVADACKTVWFHHQGNVILIGYSRTRLNKQMVC
jgi:hypothetical protein